MRAERLALALALVACGAPSDPPAPAPPSSPAASTDCHAELEAIGRCLHAVVMLTHEEPASPDVMPSFLGRATWTIAAADVHAVCEPLGLREQSDVIRLSDGSEVQVTRTEDIDEFDDGETVFNILYRFETPTCPEPAETSLQLHMGG